LFHKPSDIDYFERPSRRLTWSIVSLENKWAGADPSLRNKIGTALGYLYKLELLNHTIAPKEYLNSLDPYKVIMFDPLSNSIIIDNPISVQEWCSKWIKK